jgi:antagonist of KipI
MRFPQYPVDRPFQVAAGEVLDLSTAVQGGRGYLAVSGGWDVPRVMGSASTHLGAGFGGWQGRALREGDRLPLGAPQVADFSPGWGISGWAYPPPRELFVLRVLRGPEATSDGIWQQFLTQEFEVTPESNRIGIRLRGKALGQTEIPEMVSQPVTMGTVQLPPDGQPVVLMADRQAMGGYPRLAAVISVDLSALASAPVGQTVRFEEIGLAEAEHLRLSEQDDLRRLAMVVNSRLNWNT